LSKVHVQIIEVGEKLRLLVDQEFDLTSGSGLPVVGDSIHIYDSKRSRTAQFLVIERHWNIGNVIGTVVIYVSPTSDEARRI